MQTKQELTKREEAVLRLYVLTGETMQIKQLFRLAYDGGEEDINRLSSLPSLATRWMKSHRVAQFLETQRAAERERKDKERMRIESEILARVAGKGKAEQHPKFPKFIDYSKPENQVRKLNELINTAKSPDSALDALKIAIARQEELAPAKRSSERASRVYLPLRCEKCPLYEQEKEKLQSNNQ